MATWPCGEPRGPNEGGWGPGGPTHPGSPPLGPSQVLAGVGGQVWGLEGRVQEAPEAWLLSHLPSLLEHLTLGIGAPTSAPPRLGLASGPSKWQVLSSQARARGFRRHMAKPQSSVVAPRVCSHAGRGHAQVGLTSLLASPQALHGRCRLSGHPHAGHGPALLPWPDNQAPQVGPGQTAGWRSPETGPVTQAR